MSEYQAVADPSIYVRETISPKKAERFHATPARLPADLADAYRRLRAATGRDAGFGAAWKLGGTTPTTQAAFHVSKVYFAPLHASEIVREPSRVSLGHLCELKGEVEIALRLSPAAAQGARGEDAFDAWCVALEMPASAILNLPEAGVAALIADRCAAGALILGPAHPMSDTTWQEARSVVLQQDGSDVARGGVSNLVASPLACAAAFLEEASLHGFAAGAGQWISTGGFTPCAALQPGRITVLDGETAVLDFELAA